VAEYSLKLNQVQNFRSQTPTRVENSPESTKLQAGFASFNVEATKASLMSVLACNSAVQIKLIDEEAAGDRQVGSVAIDLKELLSAPLKKAANGLMVRVCDQTLAINSNGKQVGSLRVIQYLEDSG
jgi:hypothetical protein